jgi:hypothetical protein
VIVQTARIFARWARNDYYSYIRIVSARYHDPSAEAGDVMFVVSCELRNLSYVRVQEHGRDLDEVVRRVDVQMPDRPAGYVVERPEYTGWLTPFARPVQRLVVARNGSRAASTARHTRIALQRQRRR